MQHLSLHHEHRLAALALVMGTLLTLTACGGGGGGGSEAGAGGGSNATVGVPSPPSSAGGSSTAVGASTLVALDASTSCGLPDFRNSLLQQINAARAVARSCGGTSMAAVGPLAWNDPLFSAAARHSTDMAANNYFSHTGWTGGRHPSALPPRVTRGRGWGKTSRRASPRFPR